MIQLVECPRDAMQGWKTQIPTSEKVDYINALLQVGFDIIDFGSFVSPKAIPQMADTAEVIAQLDKSGSKSKLLAIIANTRGAAEAAQWEAIDYLGFPFSISETFQLRNTNKTIAQSLEQVKEIQDICIKHNKKLVIYISMGFGNPYGDSYNADIAIEWVNSLTQLGIGHISMADTVGMADVQTINYIFDALIPAFPEVVIGAHFHAAPNNWEEKIAAAYASGCRIFDSAINGIGGCPMAKDDLVGNLATENILQWLNQKNIPHRLDQTKFNDCLIKASRIFV